DQQNPDVPDAVGYRDPAPSDPPMPLTRAAPSRWRTGCEATASCWLRTRTITSKGCLTSTRSPSASSPIPTPRWLPSSRATSTSPPSPPARRRGQSTLARGGGRPRAVAYGSPDVICQTRTLALEKLNATAGSELDEMARPPVRRRLGTTGENRCRRHVGTRNARERPLRS